MTEKRYTPLEDRVLIEEIKKDNFESTETGIAKVQLNRPDKSGIVKRVGKGRYAFETGEFIETTLQEGDKVIFGAGAGMPLDLDLGEGKKEYYLMREGDVLMKV